MLTAIVLGSGVAFLFHSSVNNPYLASYQPPILYLGLLAFVLNPTNVLFKVCLDGLRGASAARPVLAVVISRALLAKMQGCGWSGRWVE